MFLYLTQAYLNTLSSSSFFFLLRLHAPIFTVAISLYSPSPLHPNLPPIDFVENPLDACPIRTS